MPIKYEQWLRRSVLANGKPGNRIIYELAPFCVLAVCDHCGKLGNADGIKCWWYRGYTQIDLRFSDQKFPREPTLCMSCFNKYRPLWRAEKHADECRRLINRIKREAGNVRSRAKNVG